MLQIKFIKGVLSKLELGGECQNMGLIYKLNYIFNKRLD